MWWIQFVHRTAWVESQKSCVLPTNESYVANKRIIKAQPICYPWIAGLSAPTMTSSYSHVPSFNWACVIWWCDSRPTTAIPLCLTTSELTLYEICRMRLLVVLGDKQIIILRYTLHRLVAGVSFDICDSLSKPYPLKSEVSAHNVMYIHDIDWSAWAVWVNAPRSRPCLLLNLSWFGLH